MAANEARAPHFLSPPRREVRAPAFELREVTPPPGVSPVPQPLVASEQPAFRPAVAETLTLSDTSAPARSGIGKTIEEAPQEAIRELAKRVAQSVEALRKESEHLAELARADAVELGFQIARRIIDADVQARPEALFSLVRAAVQRLANDREVTVRLSPEDAALVKSERGKGAFAGLRLVKVRVVADASLARGDCLVEGPSGTVDGRVERRLAEVRDAFDASAAEPGTPGEDAA